MSEVKIVFKAQDDGTRKRPQVIKDVKLWDWTDDGLLLAIETEDELINIPRENVHSVSQTKEKKPKLEAV